MSININAAPGLPYATAAQTEWERDRASHALALQRSGEYEDKQYDEILHALRLFKNIKEPLDTDQRAALGLLVATKSFEAWELRKQKTAAIMQGTADAMGITRDALLDQLREAEITLPAEIQAARVAIATV